MRGAGQFTQSVRNMARYLDRLITRATSQSEQLNIIRQGGEEFTGTRCRQGHSEQEPPTAATILAYAGIRRALAEAGKLKELTVAERRLAEQRQNNAEALVQRVGPDQKEVRHRWSRP